MKKIIYDAIKLNKGLCRTSDMLESAIEVLHGMRRLPIKFEHVEYAVRIKIKR